MSLSFFYPSCLHFPRARTMGADHLTQFIQCQGLRHGSEPNQTTASQKTCWCKVISSNASHQTLPKVLGGRKTPATHFIDTSTESYRDFPPLSATESAENTASKGCP